MRVASAEAGIITPVLFVVTVTDCDPNWFPWVSMVVAVNVWLPLDKVPVLKLMLNGAALAAPIK